MSQTIFNKINLPHFKPCPLFRSGFSQTVAAYLFPSAPDPTHYHDHNISLDDGDKLSLHISQNQSPQKHIVLMIHGLGGSFRSKYLQRLAPKLIDLNYKVGLLNLRGCGTGLGLAKSPYHSGRSQDVQTVLHYLAMNWPDHLVTVLGFSLGGNIALKLAGENQFPANLHSVLSVSPPLCLHRSVMRIMDKSNRLLHNYYLKQLNKHVNQLHAAHPDMPLLQLDGIRTLLEFDDRYTAPRSGFKSAVDYYNQSSCFQFIETIKIPALILYAQDDPVVCPQHYQRLPKLPHLDLIMTQSGGHVGWLGNRKSTFRWMDLAITRWLEWVT